MERETIVHGACPHDCPDTCAWLVTVRNGQAVQIAGDPTHPHTKGFLCAKVQHYLSFVYHRERLATPLKRIGRKGKGLFREITWNEAFGLIADEWRHIAELQGAEAILPFSYSGTLGVVHNESLDRRFFNRLGASELARTICSAAGTAGVKYTVGARLGADPESLPDARLILLWGSNPATTHPHYIPLIQKARENGATVVLIDPRRTLTANHADLHVPLFPGTDSALALGIMHILVRDNLVDRTYLARHTTGFDALLPRLAEYPPDRVSAITRLPVAMVERIARLYGTTRPSLIRLGYGPQRHPFGGMAHRTVACLPALTGQYGVRGGGLLFSTSDWAAWDTVAMQRPDLRAKPARSVNMVQLGDALRSTNPAIASLYVYNSNPAAVLPDQSSVLAGLAREDLFTVVHDLFRTDTTDYADIVLPAVSQLERMDLHKPYGSLYLALNQQAITPLADARSNTEVFRGLSRAMGFSDPCLQDDDRSLVRTALAGGGSATDGITLEGLEATGWTRLHVPAPAVPFADGVFPTPSGRVELYSSSMAKAGLDPLPNFTPEPESPLGDRGVSDTFPLYLITPGAHHFLNSTFGNVPELQARQSPPSILVNPMDAVALGIVDGQMTMVTSPRGSCQLTARVTERVQPGVVCSETVWWNRKSPGARNANSLTSSRVTDMGGGPVFYNSMVRISVVAEKD